MRVWVLGSGSRGNAILVECGKHRLLIDAGFPAKVLESRLEAIGVEPKSIEHVVITHEHTDHVQGAAGGAKKWGWNLHATVGTTIGTAPLEGATVHTFRAGRRLSLGRFDVDPVAVSHDASEPVTVVVTSTMTGARVGIAYDLGLVTGSVRSGFQDLDVLVLEANHDDALLAIGPYPPSVRERISGRRGHLNNQAAAAMARACAHPGLNHLVLAHLSESCNHPELAREAVTKAIAGTRFRGSLHVATQDGVVGPFMPSPKRMSRGTQLTLGI